MAKTDLPEWGFGFAPPNINPVDASFIKFFPCDSAETPSSNVDVNTQSYNAIFTVPVSHTRPPAWSRIAIQPHASTKFTGLIMKRVGLTPPRTVVNAHIIVQKESARAAAEREVEDEDRRIRRRLNNYEPSVQAAKLDGKPASQAEMAHLIMRAKVDASNNFMITSTSTPFADKQEARAGRLTQVCPVKRYRTVDYSTPLDPAGGNSFTIYREVIPIITRAMRKGMDEVDYTTASIATTSRIMRDMRRSRQPRLCLAAHGTPDLSDISDATEPDTSYSIKPPVIKAESRSPRKRIAKLTSTVKGGLKRLTQIVKLSPGSSPKAEPSPSKSDSTPSTPLRLSPPSLEPIITPSGVTPSMTTPFRDAATPSRPIITPSGVTPSLTTPFREVATPSRPIITPSGVTPSIASSPLSQSAFSASDLVTAEDSPSRPGFTFQVPDSTDFSTLNASQSAVDATELSVDDDITRDVLGRVSTSPDTPRWLAPPSDAEATLIMADFEDSQPTETQSPKFARPVAPTPSRWHRHEPFSPATAPSTPCQSDSPIGLATLIPPSTPTSAKCPYESPNGSDFRFGAMSPAFNNSISWMNPPIQASDSHRIKNLNSARRRQSEPLIRKYLKSQARRQSSSPRKVRFQDEDSLFENTSIASIFQSVQSNVAEAVDPAKTTVSVSDMTMADPTNADPAAAATPAAYAPTLEDGVLNIDMRQNLDIFHASPVSQLAEIAHDSCSGHAKVVVNEENGRLFVRFKLSAEHAHMFPASQGFNDSQFAFSPLAASRSPRITFNSRQPAFNPAQSTPVTAPTNRTLFMETPTNLQASAQRTPSVLQASSSLSVLDHTPSITGLFTEQSTTPASQTPTAQTADVAQNANSSSVSDNITPSANPLSPEETSVQQTPIKPADETTPAAAEQSIASLTPTKSAEETIPAAAEQSIASLNPTPAADNSDKLAMNTTPIPAQTFTTSSFTPVNKTSPRTQITTPSGESQTTYKSTPAKNTEATENSVPSEAVSQQVYDDSPGRDYMRAFIKRSRRASTTEAGSPIAPPLKRKPLEAKSPNTPSPQKKRKLQKDEAKSPLGKQPEENQVPVPKRVRRTPKASRQKTDLAIDMEDHPASAVDATAQADEQEDGEEQNAPARRSTRLRSTRASSAPKSSIPTAIKLGGRSGAGRGTILNSTVRSDQQELNAQTRLNTKRNKGDAEYPAQVLARVAESGEVSDASEASSNTSGGSGDRKSVVWKDPLEDVQTEEKPKKGRTAAKAKATQGKTGIAKPSQKRSAKVAESLGMVANGTPARPKRMTRSQTRSQS